MSGYRAIGGRESTVHECPSCLAGGVECPCVLDAMASARGMGDGAKVMRGNVVLAFLKPINSGALRMAIEDANARAAKGAA